MIVRFRTISGDAGSAATEFSCCGIEPVNPFALPTSNRQKTGITCVPRCATARGTGSSLRNSTVVPGSSMLKSTSRSARSPGLSRT